MQVIYFDECKWADVGDGLIYHFTDSSGAVLAEIALRDSDAKLWKFQVILPEKYQLDGHNPGGLVYSQLSARRVAETILLCTIVTK